MEYVLILIIFGLSLIFLKFIFSYNIKKIEELAKNEKLDEIAQKYPSNIEICKKYLKKLKNEKVEIVEDESINNCLYIAISNKILIANIKDSYTRIQTIAHECLHSVQDRKLLIFNFIYSNIFMLFFIVISILGLLKVLPYKMLFIVILTFMGFIYFLVRAYLENDAMIKARYLAKEYMEEEKITSQKEIDDIVAGFDELNNKGIKCLNYNLFFNVTMQVIVFALICLLR